MSSVIISLALEERVPKQLKQVSIVGILLLLFSNFSLLDPDPEGKMNADLDPQPRYSQRMSGCQVSLFNIECKKYIGSQTKGLKIYNLCM